MKLTEQTRLDEIKGFAKRDPEAMVVYAVHTCWWNVPAITNAWYGGRLPVDPRGSPLFQAALGPFLESAVANPEHYGRHGLRTFMAAFHGNLVTDEGMPTSFGTWEEYDKLLEEDGNEHPT